MVRFIGIVATTPASFSPKSFDIIKMHATIIPPTIDFKSISKAKPQVYMQKFSSTYDQIGETEFAFSNNL